MSEDDKLVAAARTLAAACIFNNPNDPVTRRRFECRLCGEYNCHAPACPVAAFLAADNATSATR